jgi:hypothetical protein
MLVHAEPPAEVDPSVEGARKVDGGIGGSRPTEDGGGPTEDDGSPGSALYVTGGMEDSVLALATAVVGRKTCEPFDLPGINCCMISKCSKPFVMKGFA